MHVQSESQLRPRRKFLLVTIGSHGDVHPFVGLGAKLRDRGHDVTLMASARFESLARNERLNFTPFGTVEEYHELTKNPDLWHPRKGPAAVFGSVLDTLELVYRPIEAFARDNPDVTLIGSSLAWGARCAQEKFDLPMATVHLSPSIFRSSIEPPKLSGLFMPKWLPLWVRRATWAFGDKFVIDPMIAPRLNVFRATIGLPPVKHVLRDWWNSPDLIIGMFPEWFGRDPGDWWSQTKLTGFPLYDERGVEPMPEKLEAFLNGGDKPIAFTPGSAMRFGESFFAAAVDACQQLNRRGVLLTRHPEQVPSNLPSNVIHVDYAPFSELLPRCAASVHHGGIGSTAQALRAGVPQLIMTLAHDQFDNGQRVQRLGVGDVVSRGQVNGRTVAAKLRGLLEDSAVNAACRAVAKRFNGIDGLTQTCELVEHLATRRAATLAPRDGAAFSTRQTDPATFR